MQADRACARNEHGLPGRAHGRPKAISARWAKRYGQVIRSRQNGRFYNHFSGILSVDKGDTLKIMPQYAIGDGHDFFEDIRALHEHDGPAQQPLAGLWGCGEKHLLAMRSWKERIYRADPGKSCGYSRYKHGIPARLDGKSARTKRATQTIRFMIRESIRKVNTENISGPSCAGCGWPGTPGSGARGGQAH